LVVSKLNDDTFEFFGFRERKFVEIERIDQFCSIPTGSIPLFTWCEISFGGDV
jgi:hypothetical protein